MYDALRLLVEMRHIYLLPNVIDYSSAISAWVKGGQKQHAIELFVEVRHEDPSPNVTSYSSAISTC